MRGGGGEESAEGQADQRPQPSQRPQPREFDVPKAPRRWIAQQADAAKENLEKAVLSGAGRRKLKKAEERKQRLDEILKQAGGPPTRELHFEIKAEAERKRKARKAFEALQVKVDQAEERIQGLRRDISGWLEEQQECKRREAVAEQRFEYLAAQQLADAMSEEKLARIREVAAAIVSGQGRDTAGPIMELVAIMVSPPAEVNLAADDSDDGQEEESNATRLDLEDDPMGDSPPQQCGEHEDPLDRTRRELGEAKQLLSAALRHRQFAIQEAEEAQRKRQRTGGGGDGGCSTQQGEEEGVPPLRPEHVERMHNTQIEVLEKQVRRLEDELEELVGQTVPPLGAAGRVDAAEGGATRERSLSPSGGDRRAAAEQGSGGGRAGSAWGQAFDSRFTTAEDRDRERASRGVVAQAMAEVGRDADELRRVVETNAIILDQQRMQEQQELEAEAVRQVHAQRGVMDDGAKLARAQRRTFRNLLEVHGEPGGGPAPLATFGPTGNSLCEMQSTMRQSITVGAGSSAAARWDRAHEGGRRPEDDGGERRRGVRRGRSQSAPARQPREEVGARGARSKSPRGLW